MRTPVIIVSKLTQCPIQLYYNFEWKWDNCVWFKDNIITVMREPKPLIPSLKDHSSLHFLYEELTVV